LHWLWVAIQSVFKFILQNWKFSLTCGINFTSKKSFNNGSTEDGFIASVKSALILPCGFLSTNAFAFSKRLASKTLCNPISVISLLSVTESSSSIAVIAASKIAASTVTVHIGPSCVF
jgi:hypothetical protein